MEVESMITDSPSCCTIFTSISDLVCLALNARFIDVVLADSTVLNSNIYNSLYFFSYPKPKELLHSIFSLQIFFVQMILPLNLLLINTSIFIFIVKIFTFTSLLCSQTFLLSVHYIYLSQTSLVHYHYHYFTNKFCFWFLLTLLQTSFLGELFLPCYCWKGQQVLMT